ncbi:MAG: RNA ligase family protein [Chloroflexota bacterium]
MSEFHVEVIRVGPITKHENADSLGITQVRGYPVVVRLGDFKEGDLAVYVPVDSVVPVADPRWAFLDGHGRIKAKRLRGTFSMGLLTPAEPAWTVGQDVHEQMHISHYEPPEPFQMGGDNEKDPGWFPCYTDIEGLRRFPDVLIPSEEVWVSEKIHGANGRACWHDGRLWVGSHTGIKREDPTNLWWKAAIKYDLAERLKAFPDTAIYFEVYGQVQDLTYGVSRSEICRIAIFDVMNINTRRYYDAEEAIKHVEKLDLPRVFVLFRGAWDPGLTRFAEGPSMFCGDHVREGIVVKPAKERWDERCGRVILKQHGQQYLLRKQKL